MTAATLSGTRTVPQVRSFADVVAAGTRVQVYRNLHHRGRVVWSVRDAATRLVVAHVETLMVADCRFVVQPGGLRRARRVGQRNVHAWVDGTVAAAAPDGDWCPLSYNPWRHDTFVDPAGAPVVGAAFARLDGDGLAVLSSLR